MCDWGIMHWSVAQSLTDALVADNADYNQWTHPDVRAIARLGNSGKNTGHVRRDAMLRFPVAEGTPQPLDVNIPVMRTKMAHLHPSSDDVPIMMPNLLFESMYRYFRPYFNKLLGSGLELLE